MSSRYRVMTRVASSAARNGSTSVSLTSASLPTLNSRLKPIPRPMVQSMTPTAQRARLRKEGDAGLWGAFPNKGRVERSVRVDHADAVGPHRSACRGVRRCHHLRPRAARLPGPPRGSRPEMTHRRLYARGRRTGLDPAGAARRG